MDVSPLKPIARGLDEQKLFHAVHSNHAALKGYTESSGNMIHGNNNVPGWKGKRTVEDRGVVVIERKIRQAMLREITCNLRSISS